MPVFYDGEVRIHRVEMGPYGNNGYLVVAPDAGEAVIVDAPAEPEKLLAEGGGVRVHAILITHTHMDHLRGLEALRRATGAPVMLHPGDAERVPGPTLPLADGQTVAVGGAALTVLHTPGHTPGSSCFLVGRHLFSGDTLFPGGPGRTRTPEDFLRIVESITARLLTLPDDTVVLPGHGRDTTLGQAKEEYRVFASREHPRDLCGDVEWLRS